MKKNLLAICLKTYPDEDDMQKCCDDKLEPYKVRIYYKGEKYFVTEYYDKKYYKLVKDGIK